MQGGSVTTGSRSTTPEKRKPRAKGPRLYHRKSKAGCQRCKDRRVKCDENKPICSNCNRHGAQCIYKNASSRFLEGSGSQHGKPILPECEEVDYLQDYRTDSCISTIEEEAIQEAIPPAILDPSPVLEIPETKTRRLLELRLLQNFVDKTARTFPATQTSPVLRAWSTDAPLLGLENDNVLYSIFALSARHLLKSGPSSPELILARDTYTALALQEHSRAVSHLDSQNADAVCFASGMILLNSFASLEERDMTTYSPPMEYFQMARGLGFVFAIALGSDTFKTYKVLSISDSERYFGGGNAPFLASHRKDLLCLLRQDIPGEEWDAETQEAYEKTLSFIGWVQLSMQTGEHELGVCRRLMAMAPLAPKKFIEFVEERRPRALVILAYFFALAAELRHIWWIGNTPRREIQAIQNVLPPAWKEMMKVPLGKAGLLY